MWCTLLYRFWRIDVTFKDLKERFCCAISSVRDRYGYRSDLTPAVLIPGLMQLTMWSCLVLQCFMDKPTAEEVVQLGTHENSRLLKSIRRLCEIDQGWLQIGLADMRTRVSRSSLFIPFGFICGFSQWYSYNHIMPLLYLFFVHRWFLYLGRGSMRTVFM